MDRKEKIIFAILGITASGIIIYEMVKGRTKAITTTTPPSTTTATISPPSTTTTTQITPPTTTTTTTRTTTTTTTTTTGGGGGGTYYGRSWFIEQAWQDWYNAFMKNAPTDYDRSQVQYYLNKYEDKLKQIIGGTVDSVLASYVDEQQIQTYYKDILQSVEFELGIAYSTNLYNIFSNYPCYTDWAYMTGSNPTQAYQLWSYWLVTAMTLSYMAGDSATFNQLKQQFESQYKCNVCNALGKPCQSTTTQITSYTVYINNQCSNIVTVYYTDPNGNNKTINPPLGTSSIEVKPNSTVTVKDASGNTILQQTINSPSTLLLCPGGGGGGGGGTTTQTYTVTVQNYCDLNAWVYYTDANGNQQQQFVYIGSVSTINVKAGSTVKVVDETGNTVYTSSPINSNTTIKLCTVLGQCKTCS